MPRLFIKRLRWIASSRIQGRFEKHASKSNKWLLMGCLPAESKVICIDGSYGGLERQTVGRTTRYLNGFCVPVGISLRRLMPLGYFNKQLKTHAKMMPVLYRQQVFTRTREIGGSNFIQVANGR